MKSYEQQRQHQQQDAGRVFVKVVFISSDAALTRQ